jgi:hypothetical protein
MRILLAFLVLLLALPLSVHAGLAENLSGRILLQVEQNGEAWYVWPTNKKRYYLGRPTDAFRVMRERGLGVSNADMFRLFGLNIGSGLTKYPERDRALFSRLAGQIVLQVEKNGEAFYLDPITRTGYYLGRPADAFRVMRERGLGITDNNLRSIPPSAFSPLIVERQFAFEHINALRVSHGKPPLVMNDRLSAIAKTHSDDMAVNIGAMSHDGSLGETAHERIKQGKVIDITTGAFTTLPFPDQIAWSGENVGMRDIDFFNASTERAIISQHEWFLDEPPNEHNHRTTMLSTLIGFTEIGIGLTLDTAGQLWITEDYISHP